MTAPQAPVAETADRKSEALRARQLADEPALESAPEAVMRFMGVQAAPVDPGRITALQRAAGNGAVVHMLQRQPLTTETQQARPKYKGRPKGPTRDEEPLRAPDNLWDAIDKMPPLVENIGKVIERQASRMEAKGFQAGIPNASISAAIIFARDTVYFFDGSGTLFAVETNLVSDFDPAKPAEVPAPKFALPNDEKILLSEPSTGRTWQVWAELGKSTNPDDEDADPEIVGLDLRKVPDKPHLPAGLAKGELVVSVYMPFKLGRMQPNIPQPGYKAEQAPSKDQPSEPPNWAKKQYDDLQQVLATMPTPDEGGADVKGTGAGEAGAGPGGGGTADKPVLGSGPGTGATVPTERAGTGGVEGKKRRRRAKPDKAVLWQGKSGPMVNVWKNGTPVAIPLKPGEHKEELKQRVEEAAGTQVSTGKTLADAVEETGIVGGQGGAKASLEEIMAATEFTANAAAYPSKIDMQGGSGAEVSPEGWATTISGAKHDFDMILDYDARHFGLANQVFARLGNISYFWQLIDISDMDASGNVRSKGQQESQEDFDKLMQRQAVIGQAAGKDRTVSKMEGFNETISDVARTKWEDGKEDLWRSKAQGVGLVALDAAWSIGKALVSAWVEEMTKPENRRTIAFGKSGEFLVRCLANPQPDASKPTDKQTRRATSIAVFPVRVENISSRAKEVTHQDTVQLHQTEALLASLEEQAKKDPKNESLQAMLRMTRRDLGLLRAKYAYSTVEKIGSELSDYDKQIAVLEKLRDKDTQPQPADLSGDEREIGFQVQDDVRKRFGRDARAFVAWWDYEYHEHDVKEAREKKAEQKQLAEKKEASVEPGSALRPRVTFVSEENGALVKMDMILGRSKNLFGGGSRWTVADVTSEATSRSYDGMSGKEGAEGDVEAVNAAFQAFCDKAEYGRGTISIELPGHEDLIPVGKTMLMKPGEGQRWRARLKSLIEIAGLVAPYVKGGQLIGRLVAVAGALESAERLYDRAVNDRLKADFETLTDVLTVLAPMAHGAASMAEKLPSTSAGKYVLSTAAKGIEVANEYLMPATFVHDLDKIMKDTSLDGPARESQIVMLFGRGLRDGAVQYVKVKGPTRAGGEPLATAPHEGAVPHEGTVPGVPGEGGAPIGTPTAEVPAGAPGPTEQHPLAADVHKQANAVAKQESTAHPTRTTEEPTPAPSKPVETGGAREGAPTAPETTPRSEGPDTRPAGEYNIETMRREARPDENARARAAEYVPILGNWKKLGASGRKARVEGLINGYLAREGIPPVTVDFGPKPPEHASFDPKTWTIHLSAVVIEAPEISANDFARFVDNAVHETQHTVTTFRGVRVALGAETGGQYNPQAAIPGKIVGEALAANARRNPNLEFPEATRNESLEVYRTQVEPAMIGPAAPGEVSREGVLARLDAASKSLTNARRLLTEAQNELKDAPGDPTLQQHLADMQANFDQAHAEEVAAHNDYVAGTEELPSWRKGTGAGEAVMRQLTAQQTRDDARREAADAARAEAKARGKKDVIGAHVAARKRREAQQREREAEAQIEALRPSTEPQLQRGYVVKRGVPLTEREITGAPKAPSKGYLEPGERERRMSTLERPATPEPSPAPSAPVSGVGVPTAAGVETGAEAGRTQQSQERWGGRVIGSDIPAGEVTPSVGTEIAWDKRPASRYKSAGKPTSGTSESEILVDQTTGEKYLFKPTKGEQMVPTASERGVKRGMYASRAKASEIAAEQLGITTPDVELVEIGGRKGSLTKWVEAVGPGGQKTMSLADFLRPTSETTEIEATQRLQDLQKLPGFQDAWANVQALDYLINNVDRYQNFGNYLIEFTPDGSFSALIPIDSELSFTTTQGRAIIADKTSFLEGITYTQAMADKIRDLASNQVAFADRITPLVGDAAVAGVIRRLDELVADVNRKNPAPAAVPVGAAP